MNDIIRLITTKGCIGCEIAENLINKAINQSTFTHIKLEVIDCLNENYRHFINRYFINDYPTMLFMRENQVLTKFVGTMSVNKIIEEIKYWFGK